MKITENEMLGLILGQCLPGDIRVGEGVDLFARPAPAVSLAELVPEDTKRMDWLVSMCVEVREPLRYGSAPVFHAVAVTDEEDDYHATTLREQIDAILRNIEEAK